MNLRSCLWLLVTAAIACAADDLARVEQAEDRALAALAEGEVRAAQDAWGDALDSLARLRAEGPRPRVDAWITYVIDQYSDAAFEGGGLPDAARRLGSLALPEDAPLLRARQDWHLSRILLRLGGVEDARRRVEALGFLHDWLVCGPFENQEGGGFAREDGPEGEFQADATFKGKVRAVSWRAIGAPLCLGTVELASLFRPNEQATAYACCWVRADAAAQVVARVGSAAGFRLWLDGKLAAERGVRREEGLDQDLVPLPLGAGWHFLVVKVGQTTGEWGFRLRLTDREGRVWKPAEVCADPKRGATLAKGEAAAWHGEPPTGDLAWLQRRAKEGNASARERFHLGCLIGERKLQPLDRREDRPEFQAAAEAEPANLHYRMAYALSLRERTSMQAEQEENEVRTRLEAILKDAPDYDPASLEMARIEAKTLARGRVASDRVRSVLARHPKNASARTLEIDLLAARGLASLARRRVDDLARDFPDQPAALARLARVLLAEGRVAEAAGPLDRALSSDRFDAGTQDLAIEMARAHGELDGVVRLCDEAIAVSPLSLDAYAAKAQTLEAEERHADALAVVDRALAICPEASQLHDRRARLLDRLGRREEAIAAWKRALAVDPNDVRTRRFLEYLSSQEGAYETRYRVRFEDAVEEAKKAPKDPSSHARYLLDELVVRLNPDGTRGEYTHWIIEVLDEKGLRELGTMSIPYSAGEQSLKVLGARVVHPDGRIDDARLPAPPPIEGNGEGRSAKVTYPPLSVGDVVEVEFKTEDVKQGFFGDYFGIQFYFGEQYPLVRSRLVLLAPSARKLHLHARNGAPAPVIAEGRTADEKRYEWEVRNAPRVDAEPGMPSLSEVVPSVEVASFASWEEFGAWYARLVKDQWDSSDELKAKVHELTKGIGDPVARMRAVYDFVSQQIPYQAWEFGVHGYQPYRASQILKRGFGDCKDKATLICVMLREAGISARPVLIHADEPHGKDDLASPIMEHFNHCIALATLPDGNEVWLDGTASLHPMGTLPSMDRGATVLLVGEDGGTTKDIPWGSPEENRRARKIAIEVSADGSAVAGVEEAPEGLAAVTDRATYSAENRRTEAIEQEWTRRFGASSVLSPEFSNLTDVDVPVRYRYDVRIPSFARKRGEGLTLSASPFPLDLSSTCALVSRAYDLLLSPPWKDDLEVRYHLPQGMAATSLPAPLSLDNGVASARATIEADGHDLVLRRSVTVKVPRVSPADYAAYRGLCQDLDHWEAQDVLLDRAEK